MFAGKVCTCSAALSERSFGCRHSAFSVLRINVLTGLRPATPVADSNCAAHFNPSAVSNCHVTAACCKKRSAQRVRSRASRASHLTKMVIGSAGTPSWLAGWVEEKRIFRLRHADCEKLLWKLDYYVKPEG